MLSQEQVQIVTLAILIWFILFLIANFKLRKIPLEKRASDMPKLMFAAVGASGALTLVTTVLVNMYFPEVLHEYSIMSLYVTGIFGGAIFVWWTLYESYWQQVRAVEKRSNKPTTNL